LFTITLTENIAVPAGVVWDVVTDLGAYPHWNTFVVACESTLNVGAPIIMQVRLGASSPRRQTETILEHRPGELLSYGMRAPLRLLTSKRQHRLIPVDPETTRYESLFELRGPLSPLVEALLGANLKQGFSDMTQGIARRAESLYQQRNPGQSG
jgi:hypothetical protein